MRPPLPRIGAGILIAGALSLGAPARSAERLPTFDAEAYCTGLAGFAVNDTILRKGCLGKESGAERHVRALWGETPAQVRADCLKAQALVTPSYQGLSRCLAQAVGALWMNGELRLVPR